MGEMGHSAAGGRGFAESAINALDGAWQLRSMTGELRGLLDDEAVEGRVDPLAGPVGDQPDGRHLPPAMDPTPIYHAMTQGGWRGRLVEVRSVSAPGTGDETRAGRHRRVERMPERVPDREPGDALFTPPPGQRSDGWI